MSDGPSDRERDERGVGEVGDDSQSAKEQEARSQGAVYQGALEAVAAILIAAGIGYWLDDIFDSAPTGLLIGSAIGFASFTVRLIRLGRYVHGSDADGRPGDRD